MVTGQEQAIAKLIASARADLAAGRFERAEQSFGRVLELDPNHAQANDALGTLAHRAGRHAIGERLIARAIASEPTNPRFHNHHGSILAALGNADAAVKAFRNAIRLNPGYGEAHYNLGYLHELRGDWPAAIESYQQALRINPKDTGAQYRAGLALQRTGRHEEAQQAFERTLQSAPGHADAACQLGNLLYRRGQLQQAQAAYEQAVRGNPGHAEAQNNLGNLLREQWRLKEALAAYQAALRADPEYAEAHNNCGFVYRTWGDAEKALECFDRAVAINPALAIAHFNRGLVLSDLGRREEALAAHAEASTRDPEFLEPRWAAVMARIPDYYDAADEIAQSRAEYQRSLDELIERCRNLSGPRAANAWRAVGVSQPFMLTYQGLNDREAHRRYGELAAELMGRWHAGRYGDGQPEAYSGSGPIRLGIVSGHFRRQSVWEVLTRGLLTQLDRSRFEVYGYHTAGMQDDQTAYAREQCRRFVQGPRSVPEWVEEIRRDRPHVLLFPETGMDPFAFRLAALRLAPLQMVTWGHPETSGLPTVDCFLSGELLEPVEGDDHYTESLVRLPNLGCCFEPLPERPAGDRGAEVELGELGIPDDDNSIRFVSCGNAFKYHPEQDALFVRIAQAVPGSHFTFFEFEKTATAFAKFKSRLARAFRATGLVFEARCTFLKYLPRPQFLALLAHMDLCLDTIAFSGFTTAIQALGCNGLPVVTLQGDLMRKRLASSILRRIGVEELIAGNSDEYVDVAVRLARDPGARRQLRERITAQLSRAYGDTSVIRAIESLILERLGG